LSAYLQSMRAGLRRELRAARTNEEVLALAQHSFALGITLAQGYEEMLRCVYARP
jgi:hypothetical protein